MEPRHFLRALAVFLPAVVLLGPWGGYPPAHAAERMRAEVNCKPTEKPLVVHCVIKLFGRNSGTPIEGAKFKMYLSMPSMPMAHHMKPVDGKPGHAPGEYQAMFYFEMAGEWMIDIRTSVPARDQMQHKIMVRKKGGGAGHAKQKMKMKMKMKQQKHQ